MNVTQVLVGFVAFSFFVKSTAKGQVPIISYPSNNYSFPVGTPIMPLIPTNTGGAVSYGLVSTFAGKPSDDNGLGIAASFYNPSGVAMDTAGNLYVADALNHKIRKISASGYVTTLAGSGIAGSADGIGVGASFNNPTGLVLDSVGNVYVADYLNSTIRKVSPSGVVTTIAGKSGSYASADGVGNNARFYKPTGIAIDAVGNLYVADTYNNKIRKISQGGMVSTLAGSGNYGDKDTIASAATFFQPNSVVLDRNGNIYVADYNNDKIRKITPTGIVTTFAGSGISGNLDGVDTAARFHSPTGLAIDTAGNLYVADNLNHNIRKINTLGVVTTLAGGGTIGRADSTGLAARFYLPFGLTVDANGYVYVGDAGNNKIRKINPMGAVITLAGNAGSPISTGSSDGISSNARFNSPSGITIDASTNLYVADANNNKIRKINNIGTVSTLAGSGNAGRLNGIGANASFWNPYGVAVDANGNVYVADQYNNQIRKVSSTGVVTTLAGNGNAGNGNGIGNAVTFNIPKGVAVDANSNVYVADNYNHNIRKLTPLGLTTTFAGGNSSGNNDGIGSSASFSFPNGLAVDAAGYIYVADNINNEIRKISPSGVVTTLAGNGQIGNADGTGGNARFNRPTGVTVDASLNVYVADAYNNKIRKITPSGVVTTLAGNGNIGNSNGIGANASFSIPTGVAVDSSGNIYVADKNNNTIRKISLGFNISPTLPTWLIFDASTGIISGTPTIAVPTTTYIVSAINDSGIGSWPLEIATTIPLPVTLTSFTAKATPPPPEGVQVAVNWQTSTETNTANFIVEQSSDGKIFIAKGIVKAVGAGANAYQFTDNNSNKGINYYRLKMVDKDGSFSYSKVVSVTLNTHNLPLITIIPNPVRDVLTVKGSHISSIKIVNTIGKTVATQSLSDATNPTVSVSSLANGIYFIKAITTDGNVATLKMEKK